MTIERLIFYSLALIIIGAAVMVITSRNSVRAVLSLVLTFVASAGLWVLLESEYLAMTLIVVYVGAVMVLFLFVVMMLDLNLAPLKESFARYFPLALVIAGITVAELVWVIIHSQTTLIAMNQLAPRGPDYSSIKHLGMTLYTNYLYPFELAAVLLLVAMVAAVSLTFRGMKARKVQNIAEQISVTKAERLEIIRDMKQ